MMHFIPRSLPSILFVISICLCCGCYHKKNQLFTLLEPSATGIIFENKIRESEQFNVLNYGYFYNGGGVATGDLNNDGMIDLYFTGNMMASHLYLNKGNFEFDEIAKAAGVQAAGLWNTGVTMADVNADGWLDIYVCRSAAKLPERRKNLLFINNRDLTFTEMAGAYGLDDPGYSTQASFFDFDRDGDLDMYLLNHSVQEYAGFDKITGSYKKLYNPYYGGKLFRNDCIHSEIGSIGRFVDITAKAGITSNVLGFGLGVSVADINGDDWLDLYISNDYNEQDYCYINQRNGTFKNELEDRFDHVSLYSMGSDIGDLNNDGQPDIITLDMLPQGHYRKKMTSGSDNYNKHHQLEQSGFFKQYMRNMLHLNNGQGQFTEIGQFAGISNTDWSWSALISDYNLDGWNDIFITNGYKADYTNMDFLAFATDLKQATDKTSQQVTFSELISKMPSIRVHNFMYLNEKNNRFKNVSLEWGFDHETLSNGAAYADLDNDGDEDIVINNINTKASLYKNQTREQGNAHFIKIILKGGGQNPYAMGAKIELKHPNSSIQTKSIVTSRGFQSSVPPNAVFGLGNAPKKLYEAQITWPDGKKQNCPLLFPDTTNTIQYDPDTAVNPTDNRLLTPSLLISKSRLDYSSKHIEFNDFKIQPLLHRMYSQRGPSLAKGDLNGDGLQDLFIGGVLGNVCTILIQNGKGGFIPKQIKAIPKNISVNQVEILDVDLDGDLDVYLATGNYAQFQNREVLNDFLLINDGKANFKVSTGLPDLFTNTSSVAAGDYDRDGDLDLFIGGGVTPGKYPFSDSSYLLVNDGKGNFLSKPHGLDSFLLPAQIITDTKWKDMNQDGYVDLIIAGHWMPISIFYNVKGSFSKNKCQVLSVLSGWWNTINIEDLDGDGDQDIIAGNYGLNTQLNASIIEPIQLYAKDFDQNGSIEPLVTYFEAGKEYLIADKDDLLSQLVFLKKKFISYHSYAQASFNEVLPPAVLEEAVHLSISTLKSMTFEQNAKNEFIAHDLPLAAQWSTINSILTTDIDSDSNLDILLFGNDTYQMVQLGSQDANKGLILMGNKGLKFTVAPQNFSLRHTVWNSIKMDIKAKSTLIVTSGVNAPIILFELKSLHKENY